MLMYIKDTNKGASDMNYRAYVEGYTEHFTTLDAMVAWVNGLNRNGSLNGKVVKVWKALVVTGNCATYSSTTSREIVIGA